MQQIAVCWSSLSLEPEVVVDGKLNDTDGREKSDTVGCPLAENITLLLLLLLIHEIIVEKVFFASA